MLARKGQFRGVCSCRDFGRLLSAAYWQCFFLLWFGRALRCIHLFLAF